MTISTRLPLHAAALALTLVGVGFAGAVQAAPDDYRFEVSEQRVRPGREPTELRLRLVRVSDGQPVPDAALRAEALGMWRVPVHKTITTWMAHDTGAVVAEAGGAFRLPAELTMPGTYRLSLTASVPGESGPVRGTVVIRAAY